MKHYFTFLFVAVSLLVAAQKQGNKWYFGLHDGLDFSGGAPAFIGGGQTNSTNATFGFRILGSTAISDSSGSLLFYATGEQVWNRNHQVMPNGSNLTGCVSSTQGALAVPLPGSSNIFYLFTTDGYDCVPVWGSRGFRFNIIDMCLDNGNGDIIPGKKNLLLFDSSAEKVTAAEDASGTGYWVVGHKVGSDEVYAYHLTAAGLNTSPVISHVDTVNGTLAYWPWSGGQMKLSPDGQELAMVKSCLSAAVNLCDFNNTTGEAFNPRRLQLDDDALLKGAFGLEFSPNSTKLYVPSLGGTGDDHFYQYNINAGGGTEIAINQSKIAIQTLHLNSLGEYEGVQAGPDGKIYVVLGTSDSISVITNPNLSGAACNFDSAAIPMPNRYFGTFPTFVAGFKYHNNYSFCMDATAQRPNCIDSCSATIITQALGGRGPYMYHLTPGNYNTDTVTNLCPGAYVAEVSDAAGNVSRDTVIITPLPLPGTIQIQSGQYLFCANDSALICGPADYSSYLWNNGQTGTCIYASLAGNYYVTVTDLGHCSAQSNVIAAAVYPVSQVGVSVNGDTLQAYGASAYQWYFNGQIIDSATSFMYVAHQQGSYTVAVTDTNGCRATSDPIAYAGVKDLLFDRLQVFPSPFTSELHVSLSGVPEGTIVHITDYAGKKLTGDLKASPDLRINTSVFAPGVYFVTVTCGGDKIVRRVVRVAD